MLDFTINANEGKNDSDKGLILRIWFQASNEVMYWHTLADDKISEYSKQLLTLASALIPVIGGIAFITPQPNFTVLGFMFATLTFLIISDILGFVQIIKSSDYFRKYVALNARRARLYANNFNQSLDTLRMIDESFDKPGDLSRACLIAQSILLGEPFYLC